MSIDINWSLLNTPSTPSQLETEPSTPTRSNLHNSSSNTDGGLGGEEIDALSTSLIRILNEQLSSSKRPSFIGPITITSFSFGDLGPNLEIKDIRDVWRVFDQGDEEGDEELAEQEEQNRLKEEIERNKLRNEKFGVESGLDDERYEYINPPSKNINGSASYENDHDDEKDHRGQQNDIRSRYNDFANTKHSYSNSLSYSRTKPPTTPGSIIPRSTSNPHALSVVNGGGSNSGRSYIPFHFDPNASGLNGYGQPNGIIGGEGTSSSLFSPGLGRRTASIASLPLNRASSVFGGGMMSPNTLSQVNRTNNQTKSKIEPIEESKIPLTREHSFLNSLPNSSPPAKPPKTLPQPSSSSSNKDLPSLQLHLNLTHKSDLHLTLLTSLQVNYPSNLFMSLPLKISITGFTLESEIILAYSGGEKNRLHLTILDQQNQSDDLEHNDSLSNSYAPRRNSLHHIDDHKKLPIGQRLLPNLQIESEIGHSDAHVLRNVGKVEKFIIDVIRKTLVEELVFPNFHTIAL